MSESKFIIGYRKGIEEAKAWIEQRQLEEGKGIVSELDRKGQGKRGSKKG